MSPKGAIGRLAGVVHPYPAFGEAPARAAQEHLRETYLGPRTRRVTRPLLALLRVAGEPTAARPSDGLMRCRCLFPFGR